MELKEVSNVNDKIKSLKSLIGSEKIKSISENLEKGDVILYNEQLYKCRKSGKYSIPDKENFKKVGLRFLRNEYNKKVQDSMEELYKRMYEQFEIGDKQKNEWEHNAKLNEYNVFTSKNVNSVVLFYNTGNAVGLKSFFIKLKNWAKTSNIEDIIEFPIELGDDVITSENYENYYGNTYYLNDLAEIKLKKEVFNKAIKDEYEQIQEYIKNPKSEELSLNFFRSERNRINSHDVNYTLGKFENDKFYLTLKEDEFEYGIYTVATPSKLYIDYDEIDVSLKYDSWITHEHTEEDGHYTVDHFRLILEFSELKMEENKEIDCYIKSFWIPYFNDMIANDKTGQSARKLNEGFNKYGIFFKLPDYEDGVFEVKFKLIFTDKNQHEEWGTCGPNGTRYAFHLNEKNVRTSNCSYCTWQDKKVDITFSFKLENGEIKEQKLIFTEKTNDTEKFEKEFMETGITFEDGVLYLKVFYAIWSLDDAGEWNEWQFAHIIPPFELEFKGE